MRKNNVVALHLFKDHVQVMPVRSSSEWLWIVNELRIWAGVIAALAAVVAGAAGYAQIRLQSKVSKEKDQAFETFKTESKIEIAQLEKDTAQARLELEKERVERLKLQKAIGRRTVSDAQVLSLRDHLAGKGIEVSIMYRSVDPEGSMYAKDLDAALRAAGVTTTIGYIADVGPEIGLVIHANPSDELSALENAFRASAIDFEMKAVLPIPQASKRIGLSVGARPPK